MPICTLCTHSYSNNPTIHGAMQQLLATVYVQVVSFFLTTTVVAHNLQTLSCMQLSCLCMVGFNEIIPGGI